jgi:hypothetical protein
MAVGVVRLPAGATILQQLHVEEALFKRRPDRSYLLVHHAAPPAGTTATTATAACCCC